MPGHYAWVSEPLILKLFLRAFYWSRSFTLQPQPDFPPPKIGDLSRIGVLPGPNVVGFTLPSLVRLTQSRSTQPAFYVKPVPAERAKAVSQQFPETGEITALDPAQLLPNASRNHVHWSLRLIEVEAAVSLGGSMECRTRVKLNSISDFAASDPRWAIARDVAGWPGLEHFL